MKPLKPIFENVPQHLKDQDRWLVWRLFPKKDKPGEYTKIPADPKTGHKIDGTDPDNWMTFDQAKAAYEQSDHAGVGVAIQGGPWVGVDVDHCIQSDETMTDAAVDILETLQSYAEISPSGTGVRVFCIGEKPGTRQKTGDYEMYDHSTGGRFLTVTGHRISDQLEPQSRPEAVKSVYNKYLLKNKKEPAAPPARVAGVATRSDREIIEAITNSQQGPKFVALFNRDMGYIAANYTIKETGEPDWSAVDLALCNILAFWTGKDPAAIDRIFRSSALYREKWNRDDYRGWTIGKAIDDTPDMETRHQAPVQQDQQEQELEELFNSDNQPDSMEKYLSGAFQEDVKRLQPFNDKPSGFQQLDLFSGGLYPGLYVVGGISSVGKTTFIHQMADQLAEMGDHVLFFSLEQSRFELASKSLARITAKLSEDQRVEGRDIRKGQINQVVVQAAKSYADTASRISVIEGNFNTNIKSIRQYVEHYIEKNNVVPVVIVDYLQIIPGYDVRQSDKQRIDTNVTELKRMSRDHTMILFVISSLNRGNYLSPIDFESFKESGGVEYTADVVWGLQLMAIHEEIFSKDKNINKKREKIRTAKREIPRRVELVCLKNRNGGDYSVPFTYYPQYDLYMER